MMGREVNIITTCSATHPYLALILLINGYDEKVRVEKLS